MGKKTTTAQLVPFELFNVVTRGQNVFKNHLGTASVDLEDKRFSLELNLQVRKRKNAPSDSKFLDVFNVVEHEGEKSEWKMIASALVNKDGSLSLRLNLRSQKDE